MITRPQNLTVAVVLILLVALSFAAWFTYRSIENHQVVKSDVGQAFLNSEDNPDAASYINLDGSETDMKQFFGRVLYVNSWASWSPLSRDELLALNEVAGQYNEDDVVFVALNRKETISQAERFLNTLPSLPNLKIVVDTNDNFYKHVDGYAMPETLVYSADGLLLHHIRTPQKANEIQSLVEEALSYTE